MNKTISINISGQAFFIDEFAYEKLRHYLEDIRGHFNANDGRDEIMADIESRIAEIFGAALGKMRNVVLMEDVEKMIGIMGKPEDFAEATGSRESTKSKPTEAAFENGKSRYRRMYRNPDDKVIGGVCGGVAAYFNIDPVWFRLAFVLAVLLAGTGVLFYLVLWVVIPIAKTTAQKLEMKGEPVNVSNIEKNIREEMEDIEKRFRNYSKDASENFRQQYAPGFRGFIQKLSDALASMAQYLAIGVVKFMGVIFLLTGISLLIVIMSGTFGGHSWVNINDTEFDSITINDILLKIFSGPSELFWAKAGLLLGAGVPVLLLIYLGLRMILKIKENQKWVKISALVLWVIGIIISVTIIRNLYHEFHHRGGTKQRTVIATPAGSTLYLKSKIMYNDWDEEDIEDLGWHIDLQEDKSLRIFFPDLRIVKSKTDSFSLVISRRARGKGGKEAIGMAEEIRYAFTQQDSTIFLDPYFEIGKSEKWRGQSVKLTLEVPEGKTIFLDNSIKSFLDDIDNVSNTFDRDMVNRRWIMSQRGLKCIDCEGITDQKDKEFHKETNEEATEE
jgi:phage shock protein PspC (stress-responsive transcriptional regulator)